MLEDHQIYWAGGPVVHWPEKLISTPDYQKLSNDSLSKPCTILKTWIRSPRRCRSSKEVSFRCRRRCSYERELPFFEHAQEWSYPLPNTDSMPEPHTQDEVSPSALYSLITTSLCRRAIPCKQGHDSKKSKSFLKLFFMFKLLLTFSGSRL